MASEYGIMTVTQLDNLIDYDLTAFKNNAGTTRLYSDDFIEAKITQAELYIFSYIHTTYTLTDIPVNVRWAIREMAKIYMTNQLIKDKYIEGFSQYDEMMYFENVVEPLLKNIASAKAVVEAVGIDDYSFG